MVQRRHTKAEKAANDKCLIEAKAVQEKAAQQDIEHLTLMEMKAETKVNKVKMKKPRPPSPPSHACAPTSKNKKKGDKKAEPAAANVGSYGAGDFKVSINHSISMRQLPVLSD